MKKIAILGSSANPIHVGHIEMVKGLIAKGYKVIFIPSGNRGDKDFDVDWYDRKRMIAHSLMRLQGDNLEVRWDDIEDDGDNTPTKVWFEKLSKDYPFESLRWVVGSDLLMPQEKRWGKCEIEDAWYDGKNLMENYGFILTPRPGFPPSSELVLPKNLDIVEFDIPDVSSSMIREMIVNQNPDFRYCMDGVAAEYLKRFCLYGWEGEE